ncbi:hypothetical protein FOL47_007663 [Perkinsus chesapeaki]|uniref:tRNA-intron lyase n=1 Tax=Perkinsus chesapeaki TaxID=330153 RepID=A0A7J6MV89_PERCH|nr:hypothetical protein FOL47_007663 [Perkinsus chesapeaki]
MASVREEKLANESLDRVEGELRKAGWNVSSTGALKFGCHLLLYAGGKDEVHSQYGVLVCDEENPVEWLEVERFKASSLPFSTMYPGPTGGKGFGVKGGGFPGGKGFGPPPMPPMPPMHAGWAPGKGKGLPEWGPMWSGKGRGGFDHPPPGNWGPPAPGPPPGMPPDMGGSSMMMPPPMPSQSMMGGGQGPPMMGMPPMTGAGGPPVPPAMPLPPVRPNILSSDGQPMNTRPTGGSRRAAYKPGTSGVRRGLLFAFHIDPRADKDLLDEMFKVAAAPADDEKPNSSTTAERQEAIEKINDEFIQLWRVPGETFAVAEYRSCGAAFKAQRALTGIRLFGREIYAKVDRRTQDMMHHWKGVRGREVANRIAKEGYEVPSNLMDLVDDEIYQLVNRAKGILSDIARAGEARIQSEKSQAMARGTENWKGSLAKREEKRIETVLLGNAEQQEKLSKNEQQLTDVQAQFLKARAVADKVDKDAEKREKHERKRRKKEHKSRSTMSEHELISLVPTERSDIYRHPIDWDYVLGQSTTVQRTLWTWVRRQVSMWLGSPDRELTDWIMRMLNRRTEAPDLARELRIIVDEEADAFVEQLYRILVFETLRKQYCPNARDSHQNWVPLTDRVGATEEEESDSDEDLADEPSHRTSNDVEMTAAPEITLPGRTMDSSEYAATVLGGPLGTIPEAVTRETESKFHLTRDRSMSCTVPRSISTASSLKDQLSRGGSTASSFDTTASYSFADNESRNQILSDGCVLDDESSEFYLWGAARQIPLEEGKMWKNGEDACFIGPFGAGVADGVGEWGEKLKVNPKKFADELMAKAEGLIEESREEDASEPLSSRASNILSEAHQCTKAYGSSTALVAMVEGSQLGTASVGDSVAMVYRRETPVADREAVLRTDERQHTFNMPYQLTRVPDANECDALANELPELVEAVRNKSECAVVNCAENEVACDECALQEGDLVILCTDGLTDNVWPSNIARIVSEAVSPLEARRTGSIATPPEEVASALADEALEKSKMTRRYKSPFGAAYKAHYGTFYAGGKRDDITVVAAWVMASSPSSGNSESEDSVERRGTFASMASSSSSSLRSSVSERQIENPL